MTESHLPALVAPVLQQEIEQFLYAEAAVLDARQFDVWLTLLAHDLHYFMPIRRTMLRRERDFEISAPDEAALFDEDKRSMEVRVRRLNTGLAWAEEPPSRTRHLVSNVRIGELGDGQYHVRSYFALHRSRLERDVDLFFGERVDTLRRADNGYGFVIARRTVYLDQATVLAPNLSMFF
ncbi:MAG: 3-phenylpropionate/cinnamic acid dioxygenase subunit beta [Immundisolibacter sp.]